MEIGIARARWRRLRGEGVIDAVLNYLRQPGFERLWPLVKEKYERHGRAMGSVRLQRLTDVEREAIGGLLAVNLHGMRECTVRLADLDRALVASRFGVSLEACLGALFGVGLVTLQERASTEEASWAAFCDGVLQEAGAPVCPMGASQRVGALIGLVWARRLISREGVGYRTFLECYEEYRKTGSSKAWLWVMRALRELPVPRERLPIFAARITGDPHGFDRNRLAGRLLYWGILAYLQAGTELGGAAGDIPIGEMDGAESYFKACASGLDGDALEDDPLRGIAAMRIRDEYAAVGLVLDDISSFVAVAGWSGLAEQPALIPLHTIERLGCVSTVPRIYVVENPSVFGALIDRSLGELGKVAAPVICVSGQPALAAISLFDLTREHGTQIFYNGDFDVRGLQIASALAVRYGERFIAWHLDGETYGMKFCEDAPGFSTEEVAQLRNMRLPWSPELTLEMAQRGRKLFQEHIISLLIEDFIYE